jgi:enoyl-CoA hydratase/carnithine racemase
METLKLTQKENYSILTFDRGRSNPMNLQMFEEMIDVLRSLKNDESSQVKKIFILLVLTFLKS